MHEERITLVARAIADMPEGTPVTFDYTLHEWQMSSPFACAETGIEVSGWMGLAEEDKEKALPFAMPHIVNMHNLYLFGQSSRC